MPEQIRVRFEGPVEIIEFCNPPANLISNLMLKELCQELGRVREDAGVRALVLTGGVPEVFILHYDVNELLEFALTAAPLLRETLTRRAARAIYWLERKTNQVPMLDLDRLAELLTMGSPAQQGIYYWSRCQHLLDTMDKPVIAAINGVCMGGGCELALCCDFRFMARGEHYRIGLPEALIGIIPGSTGTTQRLPRIVGEARALEMLMTGEPYTADRAEQIGLINQALDPDRVLPEALDLAQRLGRGAPLALAAIRRSVRHGGRLDYHRGRVVEMQATLQVMASADATSGMRRYVEDVQNPQTRGDKADPAGYFEAAEEILAARAVSFRGR